MVASIVGVYMQNGLSRFEIMGSTGQMKAKNLVTQKVIKIILKNKNTPFAKTLWKVANK